ncbi:MAG: metallophosphoesterase [Bacteroidota bacterium]
MKIIQITDIHIDREEERPFDIDVRTNFDRILSAALDTKPDHLIFSGDLCCRVGEMPIYEWIRERLEEQPLGFDLLAGNHDDAKMMAKCFAREHLLTNGELYYAKKLDKYHSIFLDSSKGYHSDNQLKWLKRQLLQAQGELLVFMHHPPVKAGVPFMDNKYPLKDMDKVQELLLSYSDNITVFCGHYHVERSIRLKNILVYITPSCFFQIDANYEDFKVDHHRIAFREIDLSHQMIRSHVRYFEGTHSH